MTALLEVDGLVRRFGGVHAVDGATFAVERRLDHVADRPERRRQVDALQRRRGFLRADGGRVLSTGSRIDRRPPHAIARGRARPHLPDAAGARRA